MAWSCNQIQKRLAALGFPTESPVSGGGRSRTGHSCARADYSPSSNVTRLRVPVEHDAPRCLPVDCGGRASLEAEKARSGLSLMVSSGAGQGQLQDDTDIESGGDRGRKGGPGIQVHLGHEIIGNFRLRVPCRTRQCGCRTNHRTRLKPDLFGNIRSRITKQLQAASSCHQYRNGTPRPSSNTS